MDTKATAAKSLPCMQLYHRPEQRNSLEAVEGGVKHCYVNHRCPCCDQACCDPNPLVKAQNEVVLAWLMSMMMIMSSRRFGSISNLLEVLVRLLLQLLWLLMLI